MNSKERAEQWMRERLYMSGISTPDELKEDVEFLTRLLDEVRAEERDACAKVSAVEKLVRESDTCGEAGCATIAVCELKRALGWAP